MIRDPIGFVGRRFDRYGDIYHVDEGGGSHLYVSRDPDLIREVLVTKASSFVKKGSVTERLGLILGNGLLTADGETWKRQRTLMQPGFHKKRVAGYANTMVRYAETVGWPNRSTVDVSDEMMQLTLSIVCKALFDHDVTGATDDVAKTMAALRGVTRPSLLPGWVPTPRRWQARRTTERLDAVIFALIDARVRDGLRDDLLSMLVDVGEEMGDMGEMGRQQIRDELVTLFLAGHETTSHALTWTWYLLSMNPEVEASLHAEIDSVLGGRAPNLDDLDALPTVDRVVNEAMRLYPPAFAIPRSSKESVQVGKWHLPAGSQFVSWIYHVHHDPRWFSEPEAFRPERFAEPAHPRNAYLPFGAGNRFCIGAAFAKMEMQLLLASLARRYRLALAPDQAVEMAPAVTLAPKFGMRMVVTDRCRRDSRQPAGGGKV